MFIITAIESVRHRDHGLHEHLPSHLHTYVYKIEFKRTIFKNILRMVIYFFLQQILFSTEMKDTSLRHLCQ